MSREERRDHDILRGDFPDAFEDNEGEALSEDPECADAGLFLGLRQSDRGLQGRRKYPDLRTRKNRTQLQVDAFARQIDQMADSYMDFGVAVAEEDGLPLSCAVPAPEEVQEAVDRRVQVALGRDALHWRLKNACPCCLYKLEGEPCLKIPLMGTFDGNNSLSRFWLREKVEVQDGTLAPGASKEHLDDRVAPGDYYLAREEVNQWGKEGVEDLMKSFAPNAEDDDNEEEDGCSERWQNMKEDVTSRAYGMYDETGFFPALYRHGFVLKVVDMVKNRNTRWRSPPTCLNVLGEVAIGYDIGCKFGKMVKVHPALKELVHDKNFRALVGTFHGHGHNRLCRLDNLMTYVEGVGLEALETCESFFSKSNALAPPPGMRADSIAQQAITTYLKHTNTFDTYQGLISKYRRALEIKSTYSALRQSMRELGVQSRDDV
ncbi:hypothetical protein B0H14DRAFT_3487371 [Mycena olivaceomarginata]|nr:hypothetical protein B0H14DRAFT_3487371 [Mycena olivaceomarginata]